MLQNFKASLKYPKNVSCFKLYWQSSLDEQKPSLFVGKQTDPFHSLLEFVIDEEWEVLRRARVEVKEVFEISCNRLFEEPVVIEGLLEETVEPGL